MIISGHAYELNGKIYESPTNTLIETLKKLKKDFIYIRHSIDGKFKSRAFVYKKGELVQERVLFTILSISILRYVSEVITNFLFVLIHGRKYANVFIGVDPLNGFSAALLKKCGVVKKSIYYTVDYDTNRFANGFLNYFYHLLDRFSVFQTDFVWSVSSRIVEIRKKAGLSDKRNIFLPNIPSDDYKEYLHNKRQKNRLVTLGVLGNQMDFMGMIKAVVSLRKKIKNLSLTIIGNGPKEDDLKKLIKSLKATEYIELTGHLAHSDALDTISKSGIGLALYNGEWGFNYYGDSMKCREFFCFGLPVITTDTHSTVTEISEADAGIVCEQDQIDYEKAIEKILENYNHYSENSFGLAKKYDSIHAKLLSSLT